MHYSECVYMCTCVFTCVYVVVPVCKYVFYLECRGQEFGLGSQAIWVLILAPTLLAM